MTNESEHQKTPDTPISPKAIFFVALALVTFWLVDIHSSAPIRLKIIDARSGAPIPDAIVSIDWEIEKERLIHGTNRHPFQVAEQRTDSAGRVTISAWRKPAVSLFGSSINFLQPRIRVLEKSYMPLTTYDIGDNQEPIERELKLVSAELVSPEEYLEAIDNMADDSSRLRDAANCAWQKTPELLVALEILRAELSERGITTRIPPLERLRGKTCGNSVGFVEANALTSQRRSGDSVD